MVSEEFDLDSEENVISLLKWARVVKEKSVLNSKKNFIIFLSVAILLVIMFAGFFVFFGEEEIEEVMFTPDDSNAIFVHNLYRILLEREADTGEFNYHLNLLNAGDISQQNLFEAFEYGSESKGIEQTNSEFVALLYKNIFNREPDSEEFDNWVSLLNNGERSKWDVYLGFAFSYESQIPNSDVGDENPLHTQDEDDLLCFKNY